MTPPVLCIQQKMMGNFNWRETVSNKIFQSGREREEGGKAEVVVCGGEQKEK